MELRTSQKILPCLSLKCLNCLKTAGKVSSIDEVRAVVCNKCSNFHLISNIYDLPTSEITLFFNSLNLQQTFLENPDSNAIIKASLREFSGNFLQSICGKNFEIFKHYDNTISDIDIRTEEIISCIVRSCEKIKNQIKSYYEDVLVFLSCKKSNFIDNQNNSELLNIKFKCLSLDQSDINDKDYIITSITEANKLQLHLFDLEKRLCYFIGSSIDPDKYFLGCVLNSRNDRNYVKIKELSTILENSEKVSLDLEQAQNLLRQEILPIEKIIKINFTTFKGLIVEAFDRKSGKLLKT
jgi:hypothetical protein